MELIRFSKKQPLSVVVQVLLLVVWWPFAYDRRRKRWRPRALHGPNVITAIRLVFGPITTLALLVAMWMTPVGHATSTMVWLFWTIVGLILTDLIDGEMARMMNHVTPFGMKFDPIADKALVIGVFLGMLALVQRMPFAWPWLLQALLVLVVAADFLLFAKAYQQDAVAGRLTKRTGVFHKVCANPLGKWKYALYCLAATMLCVYYIWMPSWVVHYGVYVVVVCLAAGWPIALLDYRWRHREHRNLVAKERRLPAVAN